MPGAASHGASSADSRSFPSRPRAARPGRRRPADGSREAMRPTITLEGSLLATRRTTTACPGLAQWLPVWRESQAASADGDCFGAAVTASLQADRLAWAFFCGYQGAVQAAFQTGLGTLGALSAHESQRKITEIQTRLVGHSEPWQLVGSKSWVISGIDALTLFVLARRSDGPPQGPGSLCIVRVPLRSAGVAATAPRAQPCRRCGPRRRASRYRRPRLRGSPPAAPLSNRAPGRPGPSRDGCR